MDENLKKELYLYCKTNYQNSLRHLNSKKNKYKRTGKRPKNTDGKDLIEYFERKVSYYQSGMDELL